MRLPKKNPMTKQNDRNFPATCPACGNLAGLCICEENTTMPKPALTAESIPTGHPSMPQQLIDALAVMVLTPHIRAYLAQRDPKALEQAESALEWVKVAAVLLPMGYDEAHAVLRALCEAHGAAFTPEADRTKLEWVAGRLLGPVNAATLKRARQEQELLTRRG